MTRNSLAKWVPPALTTTITIHIQKITNVPIRVLLLFLTFSQTQILFETIAFMFLILWVYPVICYDCYTYYLCVY